jgi:predicted Rossmann fold flavoprotein
MGEFDAIIIGGGACGLMCAVQAGYLGKRVLVLEKNNKVGEKILISGGGRCNYTNLYTSNINFLSENEHFCLSAFAQFTVEDTIQFFETYGIKGEEKTLGQLFPISNKARDIVQVFENLCRELGQEIICNADVTELILEPEGYFTIQFLEKEIPKTLRSKKVVLATGGLPVKKMGATDFALKVARSFQIRVTEVAPALVPLTITGKDEEWYASLSGNTLFCRVSNEYISFEENILFTHWGLSGPAILQISSYWRPGEKIELDLFPNHSIVELLLKEKQANGKRLLVHILADHFPRKFADAIGKYIPIEKNLASLTKEDLENIDSLVHHFSVRPAGDKGYDKAEVMRGGVATEEISSKTLESKKVPGLFFGGECVDVTGWLGGYNFQWAWSSGFVIAQNI